MRVAALDLVDAATLKAYPRDQISHTTLMPKLRPGMVRRSMLAGWVTAASPWPS
ncbi:hypothetical protein D3C81_2220850 [compost metagenome]